MHSAIQVSELSRRFGSKQALNKLSFSVPTGSICGFLGPNGSGKTTTIRTLLGLIKPDSGHIELNGVDVSTDRLSALSKVSAIVETPALYPNLTGRETLKMSCNLFGIPKHKIAEMLDLIGLTQDADRKVKEYSLGMKQRIAIGRALLGEPRLIILDEPTNGLDPAGITDIRKLIKSLPEQFSATVLLSSHLLAEIEQVADHCVLINQGRALFNGELNELTASAQAELNIQSGQAKQVHEFLLKRGCAADLCDNQVRLRGQFSDSDRAGLLKELINNQFDIYHYSMQTASLEQLFIQLTNEEHS